MSYMSSTLRAFWTAQLARYTTMLAAACDAMDNAASGMHVQRYEFQSGEGSQEVVQIRPGEMANHINWLESKITWINQKLNGTGVVSLTMKRKY